MNTDKDNSESTKDWLAQELLPVISTVSGEEHRTTRGLLMKFRWVLLLCIITMSVAIFAYYSLISNPPYTVETRNVAPGGAVTYLPQQYEKWSHTEDIAAIRRYTFHRIYYCVYYNGLQYNFSRSGHVYATEGSECGAPFNFVHAWDWDGDPHQFPYYNFSHTWNANAQSSRRFWTW